MSLKILKYIGVLITAMHLLNNFAFAEMLLFDKPVQKTVLMHGQRYIKFSYNFINKGQDTVKINKIELSCGCSTYEITNDILSSGMSGTLTVVVDTLGKEKNEDIIVILNTDEKNGIYTIHGYITIPNYITVTPRMIRWQLGEEFKEKRILVSLKTQGKDKTPLYVKNVIVNKKYFDVRAEPLEDGKSYFVYVRPKQNIKCADMIKIITKPDPPPEGLSVIAYVYEKRDKL